MFRSHDRNGPSPKVRAWNPLNPESHHLLWAGQPPVISSERTFDHRLGEAWNYHSPTHPPQHFGGVSPPPFRRLPWPLFMAPSLHHIETGLLQPVSCPAWLNREGYETTYVPSLRFYSATPASGISSTSHTRMISHREEGFAGTLS